MRENKFENYLKIKGEIERLFENKELKEDTRGVLFVARGNPKCENFDRVSRFYGSDGLYSTLADFLFKRGVEIREFSVTTIKGGILFNLEPNVFSFKIEFEE